MCAPTERRYWDEGTGKLNAESGRYKKLKLNWGTGINDDGDGGRDGRRNG